MKPISVLYVIWSLGLGGAEQVVISLVSGLDRQKFSPVVCCLNDEGAFADEIKSQGIPVIALHKKKGLDLTIIQKIFDVIKTYKIDIIHTHLWGANVWGRLAGFFARIPVVITEHNVDVWKKAYHKWIDRILEPGTKKICVVSRQVEEFYKNEVGISPKRLTVIYNGIQVSSKETDPNSVQALRQALNLKDGWPVLANIGRLVEAKANHVFLEAVRILVNEGLNLQALVIGDGPLKDNLIAAHQDLIARHAVQFTGMRKDVTRLLNVTDICVLSSTREGLSIVLLEAMAKGIPIVATRVGGNPELVHEGQNGFLVGVNDSTALAARIKEILLDPARRQAMGKYSQALVQKEFSLERMIQHSQQLYEEFAKR